MLAAPVKAHRRQTNHAAISALGMLSEYGCLLTPHATAEIGTLVAMIVFTMGTPVISPQDVLVSRFDLLVGLLSFI